MSYQPYLYYDRSKYNSEYGAAYWAKIRADQNGEREKDYERRNQSLATVELGELYTNGFDIDQKTEWQYRIDETLDIYPRNHRWHNLKTGERGSYRPGRLLVFVDKHFGVSR